MRSQFRIDAQPRPAKKTKKSKAKAIERSGEQEYENGVLRALVLENFMNHKHFKVEFDPHVNFIVGKNGSGKSAIVNALIAGARAPSESELSLREPPEACVSCFSPHVRPLCSPTQALATRPPPPAATPAPPRASS